MVLFEVLRILVAVPAGTEAALGRHELANHSLEQQGGFHMVD